MSELTKVFLKSGKEQSLLRFHPWVFSGAIKNIDGEVKEGDLVEVLDNKGSFLGIGHYQVGSIMVRIISFKQTKIDHNFWIDRIEKAYMVRKELGLAEASENNTYRLIHGEGDTLPGLIVDVYDKTAVMQCHSVGMFLNRMEVAKAIKTVLGDNIEAIYDKSEETIPFMAGLNAENGFLIGKTTDHSAIENGLKYNIDFLKGQKTGFFIDQRDNRALLESFSKGKKVLNMFCYTGGFSVCALRGGAELVHSVDSSARAIELTDQNVTLNFPNDTRHQSFAVDAFKYLDDIKDKYDLIILDPPAFAKHLNVIPNALQGYKRLNAKAFEQIKPGGIIFTFSCSQVITKDLFRKAIFSAAAISGRSVRILHQVTQPADHPINIYHPEGEYLKGLILQVE